MSVCFDLSGFIGLNDSQKLQYKTAWNTFDRIQNINSNISTLRVVENNLTLSYYTFTSYDQKNLFRIGQFLHQQRYPNSNWNVVQEN